MKILSQPIFWQSAVFATLSFIFRGDENYSLTYLLVASIGFAVADVLVKLDEITEIFQQEEEFDFEVEEHDDIDLSGVER